MPYTLRLFNNRWRARTLAIQESGMIYREQKQGTAHMKHQITTLHTNLAAAIERAESLLATSDTESTADKYRGISISLQYALDSLEEALYYLAA